MLLGLPWNIPRHGLKFDPILSQYTPEHLGVNLGSTYLHHKLANVGILSDIHVKINRVRLNVIHILLFVGIIRQDVYDKEMEMMQLPRYQ